MNIRKVLLASVFIATAILPWAGVVGEAENSADFINATIFEDCPEMNAAMAEAHEALAAGDIEKCVVKYQEAVNTALKKNPVAMCPASAEEGGQIKYMFSGIEYCQHLIMEMGEEAMAINRRLYEPTAQYELRVLARGRDLDGLAVLFRAISVYTKAGRQPVRWRRTWH